ncbi:hypothetical protein BJY59DRAFT_57984 [Rhodotorula toruloides]
MAGRKCDRGTCERHCHRKTRRAIDERHPQLDVAGACGERRIQREREGRAGVGDKAASRWKWLRWRRRREKEAQLGFVAREEGGDVSLDSYKRRLEADEPFAVLEDGRDNVACRNSNFMQRELEDAPVVRGSANNERYSAGAVTHQSPGLTAFDVIGFGDQSVGGLMWRSCSSGSIFHQSSSVLTFAGGRDCGFFSLTTVFSLTTFFTFLTLTGSVLTLWSSFRTADFAARSGEMLRAEMVAWRGGTRTTSDSESSL